jgi:GPN-loop GTPase
MDPAADFYKYESSMDIRDLITVEDVMDELELGPNGGLVYCMEYLVENADWLAEQINDFSDDYLLIDCPGQIELYVHLPVMQQFVQLLQNWGYTVCCVYMLDSQFMTDPSKFLSGTLMSLAAMARLELPHVSVLTKIDLLSVTDQEKLDDYIHPDSMSLLEEFDTHSAGNKHLRKLASATASLVEEYSLVSWLPLNGNQEDSVSFVLSQIDHCLQFGEDEDVKDSMGKFDADD